MHTPVDTGITATFLVLGFHFHSILRRQKLKVTIVTLENVIKVTGILNKQLFKFIKLCRINVVNITPAIIMYMHKYFLKVSTKPFRRKNTQQHHPQKY